MPLTANYPLRGGYPFDTEYGNREVHPHQRQFFKANNAPSNVEVMFQADIFPDSILMTIFKYMHPVDLINGVSGVSRRWNKLANAPSNYTSVRVIIDEDSVTTGSAKAFLQRGSNYIRKLCLDYAKNISPGCFSHILPECMPNVTLLDISFIAGTIF
uniref:F-box domain-containing protein n=1 Tax=Ascaris lumbricoides TaxID=6252 RepID=A0A0M3IXA8_ASCLU